MKRNRTSSIFRGISELKAISNGISINNKLIKYLGLNHSTISQEIKILVQSGLIKRYKNRRKGYIILPLGKKVVELYKNYNKMEDEIEEYKQIILEHRKEKYNEKKKTN
jgi:predicted transcriptional regulator